jgi:hypothetical protein
MARQQWGGQNEAAYQLATLIARASRTKSIELSIARNRASLVTLARYVWWYLVIAACYGTRSVRHLRWLLM